MTTTAFCSALKSRRPSPSARDGQQQVAKARAARWELHDPEPERLEAFKEDPVARRADPRLEFTPGEAAHEIIVLLRAAAGAGGGQQLEDADPPAPKPTAPKPTVHSREGPTNRLRLPEILHTEPLDATEVASLRRQGVKSS